MDDFQKPLMGGSGFIAFKDIQFPKSINCGSSIGFGDREDWGQSSGKLNKALDFFSCVSGSKQWPSSDPNDSPYDKFVCTKCGWTFEEKTCGTFSTRDLTWKQKAEQKAVDHLIEMHLEESYG